MQYKKSIMFSESVDNELDLKFLKVASHRVNTSSSFSLAQFLFYLLVSLTHSFNKIVLLKHDDF